VAGLATVSMFTQEVVAEPLLPVDGFLPVRRVEPDPKLLDAARADETRTAMWEERMARVQKRSAG